MRGLLQHWRESDEFHLGVTKELDSPRLRSVEKALLRVRVALDPFKRPLSPPLPDALSPESTKPEAPRRRLTKESLKEAEKAYEKLAKPSVNWISRRMQFFKLDLSWSGSVKERFIAYSDSADDEYAFERKRVGLARRFIMAMVGGLALVVPLLITALHPTLEKALITTCIAIVLFSLYLALASPKLKETELLGSSAAYAAVLVVFVGVGLTSP